jgi:alkylation response protein AidB-like acyl-CoA dehydrogenase
VARATLGNESVSIGGGDGALSVPGVALLGPFDNAPERLTGGAARLGRYVATHQCMGVLNLRSANRAVAGGEPGPEGAITKLVIANQGHEAAFMDGAGAFSNMIVLLHRAMSIAGGTSEIKRNQIGERLLGLPRDPLIN